MNEISEALLDAYRDTDYVVSANNSFTLRIGSLCPELDQLLLVQDFQEAAFVTAFNPFSQRLTDSENQERHSNLLRVLEAENHRWIVGYGQGSGADWDREDSVLILGIPMDAAIGLGRRFKQNAIVFHEPNRETRLEICF